MSRRTRTALTLLMTASLLSAPLLSGAAQAAAEPVPPLVFTSDRDGDTEIYVRATDGRVRKLTSNRADDYGAVWSPDGTKLAFVSTRDGDREVFVMNADGTGVRQLTRNSRAANGNPASDQAPAWSPDGTRIAFASNRDGGEPEIYRMNADGTHQVRLTRTPAYISNHTPSWSPGGHYIVFASDRVRYDNYEIFRMRANGTEVTRLTATVNGVDDNSPEYSPDGKRILYSSTRYRHQHDVFTMAGNGTDIRRLSGDPSLDDVFPRWSGNGRTVLFQTFAGPDNTPSDEIWVVDSDGTDRRRLTTNTFSDGTPDPRPR